MLGHGAHDRARCGAAVLACFVVQRGLGVHKLTCHVGVDGIRAVHPLIIPLIWIYLVFRPVHIVALPGQVVLSIVKGGLVLLVAHFRTQVHLHFLLLAQHVRGFLHSQLLRFVGGGQRYGRALRLIEFVIYLISVAHVRRYRACCLLLKAETSAQRRLPSLVLGLGGMRTVRVHRRLLLGRQPSAIVARLLVLEEDLWVYLFVLALLPYSATRRHMLGIKLSVFIYLHLVLICMQY